METLGKKIFVQICQKNIGPASMQKKPKNREKDGQKLRLPIQKCMKIILPTEENIRGKDMKK